MEPDDPDRCPSFAPLTPSEDDGAHRRGAELRRRYTMPLRVDPFEGSPWCGCHARGGDRRLHLTSFRAPLFRPLRPDAQDSLAYVGLAHREPASCGSGLPRRRARRRAISTQGLQPLIVVLARNGSDIPRLAIRLEPEATWQPPPSPAPRVVLFAGRRDPHPLADTTVQRQVEIGDDALSLEPYRAGAKLIGQDLVLSPPPGGERAYADVVLGRVARGGCVVAALLPAAGIGFEDARRVVNVREGRLCQLPAPAYGLSFAYVSYTAPRDGETTDTDHDPPDPAEPDPAEPDPPSEAPPASDEAAQLLDRFCDQLLTMVEQEHFVDEACPAETRRLYRRVAYQRLLAVMGHLSAPLGLGRGSHDEAPDQVTARVQERAPAIEARLLELTRFRDECGL